MRSLILNLFILMVSVCAFGQSELCTDAEMTPTALGTFPHTETLTIDPLWVNDVDYMPPTVPAGPWSVAYWSFTITTPGYYSIDYQTTAGATIANDISIGFSDNSLGSACPMDATMTEVYAGGLMVGTTVPGGCTFLAAGTTYTIALAVGQGDEGDVEVIISNSTAATNDDCGGASALAIGTNVGDNTCSDGLVWFSYTVVNGGTVSISVSNSGSPTAISTPVISQVNTVGCGNPDEGVTMWNCLPPGTVIYFEAGDDTAPIEQGDFNIDVVDDATGLPNELCGDVTGAPVAAPSCMTTTLTDPTNNTTVNACQELIDFGSCGVFNMEGTVWFAFTTDAVAQTVDVEVTNGSISGSTFVLIDGSAGCPVGSATLGGCQTTGMLLDEMISPNTTYYIAVATNVGGTDGDFTVTVTPKNPPANDDCALGAQDISATAAIGVEGTTACASQDLNDFCAAISEDHVVYYTYMVDAGITTNRTVTITSTASTATSGTAATSLGLGVFGDCAGTPYLNTPTSGDLCDALTAPVVYECVEPGTVLTIAVASQDLGEGDFNLMITEMATGTATNDICDIATNPDITTVTMGTNFCADGEISFCGMTTAADHQVWYTYTNMGTSNVDLGLTFSGTGTATSATQVSMLVLVGDCSNTLFSGTMDTDFCNILDGGEQLIECIEVGETISIMIGSAEDPTVMGPEGDFNIAFNEYFDAPVNDECTGAVDITPPNTCEWTLVSGLTPLVSAENACPEDFATFPAGCDFTMESTVWYSITVPNDGNTYTLEIQNIANDAFISIFESTGGDCDSYGVPSISSDCETGAGPHGATYDNLTNGATYFIAVGDPTAASGFDFEIRLNVLPDNDECANAVTLTGGTPTAGTTACATQMIGEYNSGVCTDDDDTNTVWYEYEVPTTDKGFHVTITATGASPFMGDVNLVVFEPDPIGSCDATAGTMVDEVCTASATVNEEFECVGPGTYVIRIATSSANEGEFEIEITPIMLEQPNDFCDTPDLSLNPGLECEWMTATANTTGACPENIMLPCAINIGATVWYEVTAPLNADFLDLQINTDGGSNPFIAVFPGNPADCDNQTVVPGSACYESTFTDLDAIGQDLIMVTGGDTYLIAVGTSSPAGTSFEFGIKWITPPDNDECVDAETLTAGVATDGTTACATQMVGEYNSAVCTDDDDTNTVWYEYTVPTTDKGFNVTINALGVSPFMGDVNLVVFEPDPIGSCDATNGTLIDEVCTASGTINEEFECVGPGTYVIRVATSSLNEGDFQITITPLALEQPNDNCDAPDNVALNPGLECEWMVIDASTVGACPESFDFVSDCGFDDFPVTWYEVTAPANAEFLDLQINSGGVNPFIGVFESTTDCDNMTPVAGSQCYEGTFDELNDLGQLQIDINPGGTYLIGVGTDNTMGNIINFGIKWITPPDNDECADAIALTPTMPGAEPSTFTTGPIMGTTQCATGPITGTACDDDKTNTVWYNYTVEPDVKEITIDITNWVNTVVPEGMPNFSVAVFDGCIPGGAFINQADGSPADYCGGEGVDLITLSCLDEGDVITIMVSSSAENEGTFDITLNTAMPNCTYTNDDCVNAEVLNPLPIDTDEDCVITAGCNDLACSDFNFGACAGIDQLNTVFYTFTTDADADEAFVNIEILNGEAGELDNPGAVLFSGDCVTPASIGACGAGAGGEYNSGPLGGPGFIMANTTYTIMIFNSNSDQNGGTFDLCVTVSSGCVNDEACDAFTLEPGVTVVNPASSENCTPDVSITGCAPEFDEATLWYQVEVPEGFSFFEVTLVNGGVPNGVGEGLGEVSIAVGPLTDCNNINPGEVMYSDCSGFATNGGVHQIPCAVEYGTYYIQIGSADEMDAGDFEITFTPMDDGDPTNDLCSQAEELVVPDYCEFFNFMGSLKDACEELNDVDACEFSMNSAVWYKITIPDGSPVVSDMDVLVQGLGSPMIGVYEFDCSQVNEPNMGILNTPQLGDGTSAGCVMNDFAEGVVVTPGNEYYILISSSTNEQIPFNLNIKLNAPPINDDPCDASINPPLDLTGGGSHNGTTCCARGPKDSNPDGSAADFENAECSAATEDAAVWYQFTPNEADDGYNILLEPGDMEGPASLEVYVGAPGAGCTGALTPIASSCSSNTADIKIGNCFEPGQILFVKVTTDDHDMACGTFVLSILPASCGPMADECIDLADEEPIMPITNEQFEIDYVCIQGCLDYACPEDDAMGGCGEFVQMPTVWFQVTADDLAAQMFTTVEANGNWDPIWSVYSGPDCDNLSVVNFGGSPPCSNGDNTPELHQTSVFDDEPNYWIAVTIDPNSLPATGLDDGSFELCVATTINAIICLGELEGGACDDESLVMEIVDREIEDQPLEGPFCQGEEITINISFFYDASESGADWLIGFVPIFGPGWDLEGFDYAANAPVGNGTAAQWYEEDGDCAPIIQEPNPILCTFTDEDGNLQLCNQLCSPCSECETQGMQEGDPLPSGYFWVTNGGNAGCDNDCSPGEGWGIGSITAQIDWTFTIPVKEFDSFEECFENNDLSISFQTFSDGVGGCWEDPVGECILDRAMFSPPWMIECEAPPAVEGPDQELCHDGVTDIFVQTVDGSTNTIIVDVDDNPFVDGEMDHTFPGGTGTIQDDLLNLTNEVQVVVYNVYSEDLTLPCPGPINQIEVTIYPELMATFPPIFVCEGDCTDITPDIVGGIGAPHTYQWSTGESTPSINVCPVVPTTYFVTVTDDLGCSDVAEVEVDVKPPVELLLPESIDVCKDDNFDPFNPDYIVCLDFISGTAPYTVNWDPEIGLVGSASGVFGECFIINEVATSAVAGNNGTYMLGVTVTDQFGCMGETEMLVHVTGELSVVVDVFDVPCGETEATINVTGFDALGNPVTTFFLYGGCPDDGLGDFLDEIFTTTGTGNFPPVDLLSYTCYTVVAQTESGCQSTQDIEIEVTEGTPIVITGTESICIGEEATITITNASDYTSFVWTPDIGSSGSVTFTPDSTATYFVETMDATGCLAQETFTVVVNDPPVIDISGTTTFCEGGTATVTASGGVSYEWNSTAAGFPMTGEELTVSEAITVTLTVTDANNCTSDSTFSFMQDNLITINLGDVNMCDGNGDTIFVSEDFINIEWYNDVPELVSDTNFYVPTGAGSFTVQANDAATGCDAMGSFTVMNFMSPMITVTDTVEVCREDSGVDPVCMSLNDQVTGSAGTWTQVDIIPGFTVDLADLDNVCFEGAPTGCYAFAYTTNGAQFPCENTSDTLMICVKACPCPSPATQPIDPICNIGTTNLEFAEVTTDPGTWSVQSGPPGQDITGIITGTVFDANGIMAGDYVVRFTLDSPGNVPPCEEFSEQTITVFAAPMINTTNGVMCNIDGQSDPTVLDLYTLLTNADASDGGTWEQVDGPMVDITGPDMSTIDGTMLPAYPETLTFQYTSSVEPGSPCPPDVVTVEVLVRDCNCPFVNVLTDTLCNDGIAIDLFTLLENPDGLSGTWTTSGNLIGDSMFDPNGLPSGLYSITYTLDVSPGPNCETVYTNDILVRRQAVAIPTTAEPPCSVDTGNGPTTSNLYDWLEAGYSSGSWTQTGGSPDLTFTDDGIDMAVVDFAGQPIGSMFVFTFTTTGAEEPCENVSVPVTITVVDCNCPPIVLSPAADVCNDAGTIDLCALTVGSDPGTYTVTSLGGTDFSDRIDGCIFDATDLAPLDYIITFTLDEIVTGNCTQSLQDTFTVVPFANSDIMDPDEVCNDPNGNGDTDINFTMQVSNAGVGVWEDTDGAGVAIGTLSELQNVSFVGVPAGTYTFTYFIDNEEPCGDVTLTMEVVVTDDCDCPPINPGDPADVCNTDGPIDLTQYDDPDLPGTWSSTELTVENGNSLVIDGVVSGTYTLIYTITDPLEDCPETEEVTIFIGEPANPGTPADDARLCEGTSDVISLEGMLDGEDTGGVWSETSSTMSGGFNAADGTFTSDGVAPGTYTFTYTISENAPCPDVDATVTIIVDPNPVADAGADAVTDCDNPSTSIGGASSTGDDITYTWVYSGTGEEVGNTATLNVTNEGTYVLTVINSETGCMAVDSTVVTTSDDLPTMEIEVSNITCFGADDGGIIITDPEGGDGNYTFSLNDGAPTSDQDAFTTLPAGEYTISIMDGNGCKTTYEFEITEPDILIVDAGEDIIGEVGETFELSILPFDTAGIVSLIWSDFETGAIICDGLDCTTITVTPTEITTTYYVEVIDENGCTANDQVQIRLQQIVDVIFPNIISPNDDNTNDIFYVKSGDVEQVISMKIFDRWGEKLFDTENVPPRDPSVGWDGKFKERKVVPGVYVFTVEVLFIDGTRETFSGDVTVTDSE